MPSGLEATGINPLHRRRHPATVGRPASGRPGSRLYRRWSRTTTFGQKLVTFVSRATVSSRRRCPRRRAGYGACQRPRHPAAAVAGGVEAAGEQPDRSRQPACRERPVLGSAAGSWLLAVPHEGCTCPKVRGEAQLDRGRDLGRHAARRQRLQRRLRPVVVMLEPGGREADPESPPSSSCCLAK